MNKSIYKKAYLAYDIKYLYTHKKKKKERKILEKKVQLILILSM